MNFNRELLYYYDTGIIGDRMRQTFRLWDIHGSGWCILKLICLEFEKEQNDDDLPRLEYYYDETYEKSNTHIFRKARKIKHLNTYVVWDKEVSDTTSICIPTESIIYFS
jgi:hypothetical protein